MSDVSDRFETHFEQALKYVEKNKNWRPQPRTVAWLAGMIAVLAVSAIIVPRLLPGKIPAGKAIMGRGPGISVVPLGAGSVESLVDRPLAGGKYSSWAVSESRDEVAVGWYKEKDGSIEKIAVKMKSAFSGRTQTEWSPELSGSDPRIVQVGFVPKHNLIWFLAGGRLSVIDIKSAEVLPFLFKSSEGREEVESAESATFVGFSPGGRLAYAQGKGLTVVRGLATSRISEPLSSEEVLELGTTVDAAGSVVSGDIESFTWLDDDTLAVIVKAGASTSVFSVALGKGDSAEMRLLVEAPERGGFSSITHAPEGPQFALLYAEGDSIAMRRYERSGRMVSTTRLPRGEWIAPLAWGSG